MEERTSVERPAQPSPGERSEREVDAGVMSDVALDRESAPAVAVQSFESAPVDLDEALGDLAELFPSERRAAAPAVSTPVYARAAGDAASMPAVRPTWPGTTAPMPERVVPTRHFRTRSMMIVAPLLCVAVALVTYRVIERGRQTTPVLAEEAAVGEPVRSEPETSPIGTSNAAESEPDSDADVSANASPSEPAPDAAAIASDAAQPDLRSVGKDAEPRTTADTPPVVARPAPESTSVRAVPPAPVPAPVVAAPPAREPAVTRAAGEGSTGPASSRVDDAVSRTVFEADAARPPVVSQPEPERITPAERTPTPLDATVPRAAAAGAVAAAPRPAVPTAPRSRTAAVQSTLDRYRAAFSALDPAAAHAVWPSVDSSALGRAFDQLSHQAFEFDNCRIFLAGSKATASCTGTVRYVPKVGNRQITAVRQRWDFELREAGEDWSIERVITR